MPARNKTLQYVIKARDDSEKAFKSFTSRVKAQNVAIRRTGIALAGIGAAGSAAIAKLASEASKLEQLNIGFTTMLGSADAATEKIKELSEFAATTPFTLPGVEDAARGLLAVGFNAEELIPTLKMVGDVSAGLGRGEEGLRRLILNLGQVRTQGKLTGRELRDFAVLGVPLIEELANTMGVTKQEIMELTSAGAITDKIVVQAFKNMTEEGGRFANLMSKQNKTLLGQWSNMQDSLTLLSRTIGEPLVEPLTKVIQQVIKIAEAVGEFVKNNPQVAQFAAVLALIVTSFSLLAAPILLAVTALTTMGIALAPAGMLFVGIIGLMALVSALVTQWEGMTEAFKMSAQILKDNFVAAMDVVMEKINSVIRAAQNAMRFVNKVTGGEIATKIGTTLGKVFARQSGGIVSENQTIVGEQGRELVQLPIGSRVLEAGLTRRLMSKSEGFSLNINAPIIENVVVQNEADEERLAEKVTESLTRLIQLQQLRAN